MATTETEVQARSDAAAEHIREAVDGWSVTATVKTGVNSRQQIHVYSDDDHVTVNGYSKGSVINTVLKEVPSLEVDTTQDGEMAVTFTFVNDY